VGAAGDDHDAADLADEAAGVDGLGLEAAGLGVADLHAAEAPAQHRRGHERGDDRDHDDDRVHLDGEDAEAEADGRDDDLHGAAGVHAEAHGEALPVRQAGGPGADVDAADLAGAGEAEHDEADDGDLGLGDAGEVDLDAGGGEEDRGEEARGGHLEGVGDLLAEARGLTDEDADGEGAEHGLDAHLVGEGGAAEGEGDDEGHLGVGAADALVDAGDDLGDDRDADGEHEAEEQQGAADRLGDRERVDGAGGGEAGDDGQHDPADGVVGHGGGEDQLADVAADQLEVHEHLGDHRDRADAHGHGHEHGEDGALVGVGEVGVGEQEAEGDAGGERDADAEARDDEGVLAAALDEADVGLEAGGEDEEQDAEPRDDGEQVGLALVRREHVVLDVGGERAEHGGAEHDAGDELADDGGLAELAHDLAEEAGGEEEHRDLQQQQEHRVVGSDLSTVGAAAAAAGPASASSASAEAARVMGVSRGSEHVAPAEVEGDGADGGGRGAGGGRRREGQGSTSLRRQEVVDLRGGAVAEEAEGLARIWASVRAPCWTRVARTRRWARESSARAPPRRRGSGRTMMSVLVWGSMRAAICQYCRACWRLPAVMRPKCANHSSPGSRRRSERVKGARRRWRTGARRARKRRPRPLTRWRARSMASRKAGDSGSTRMTSPK
jgi:hypothetical protein